MIDFSWIIWLSFVSMSSHYSTEMTSIPNSLTAFLPDSVEGWTSNQEDRVFNPDNLFDYIDGGAELYLSYGFSEVLSRSYSKANHPEIKVDIFDMKESRNAYGVFCHVRETVEQEFGQGSQQYEGAIIFWKDRYYISLMSNSETPESRSGMQKIARAIDVLINTTGTIPEIADRLPTTGLVKESIIYFHHPVWVNALYFITDENIFNIHPQTQGVVAKYGELGDRQYVLLVKYPDSDQANEAFGNFQKHFSAAPIFQMEDKKWCAANISGNLLYCIFNASTREKAENLVRLIQTQQLR